MRITSALFPMPVDAKIRWPALETPALPGKEKSRAFTEAILQELGATPEQIDRERHRAHTELFGESPATDALTVQGKDPGVARS